MFSVCVTPEEDKYSPGETPAFTFIWSELQSPPHLWKMSLKSQCFHVSFSEFIRETVDFWICHLLFMQSEKSSLAKTGEIQALCNVGNKNYKTMSAVISAPNSTLKIAFVIQSSLWNKAWHFKPNKSLSLPHTKLHTESHKASLFSKTNHQEIPARRASLWTQTLMGHFHNLANPHQGFT